MNKHPRGKTHYIFTAFYLGNSMDFGLSERFLGHEFKFIVACSLSELSIDMFKLCFIFVSLVIS